MKIEQFIEKYEGIDEEGEYEGVRGQFVLSDKEVQKMLEGGNNDRTKND